MSRGDTDKARGGSKLRATRMRHQRNLEEDDLNQRFSRFNLSLAAPVFVPAAQPPVSTPKRSMAFVTKRRDKSSILMSTASSRDQRRKATAAISSKMHNNETLGAKSRQQQAMTTGIRSVPRGNASTKPRRQRVGTKGLNKNDQSVKSAVVSMHERHRRKLSLTSTELQAQDMERKAAAIASTQQNMEDVYPEKESSAFPQQLTLFSQQKRMPQRVASRDDVINTIFAALFTRNTERRKRPQQALSAFGDDTGTDTDEPNEDFVKRGLAMALFKDQLDLQMPTSLQTASTPSVAADHLITPVFIHALVTALRFEDFRTASARLDILRAIHKSFSTKRLQLARALADSTALRLEYVNAIAFHAQKLGVEKSSTQVIKENIHDHGHGFTELLRFLIEHVEESLVNTTSSEGIDEIEVRLQKEFVRNCLATLVTLWRAHWIDPAGSDDEELISCAGQFVAYKPSATGPLLNRLLSAWPTRFPKQEVGAIRMVARVIMSGPPLHQVDPSQALQRRVFTRLARTLQSPNVDVAKEALAFTGCQFVLIHFVGRDEVIFKVVTTALHANIENHWHDGVQSTSESNFDSALDFAQLSRESK
ncbi:putative protein phosphatase 2A, regulatory B subunit, B56, armadillo-like helical [Plasmopara halstedii]